MALVVAGEALRPELRALLSDYLGVMLLTLGLPVTRDSDGYVAYRYFDAYWVEPERTPFVIVDGGEVVGLCFLRDNGGQWKIAEFYVAPGHRRRGVAAAAVAELVAYCRAHGTHRELVATTLRGNDGALAFWRRQGFRTVHEAADHLVNVLEI